MSGVDAASTVGKWFGQLSPNDALSTAVGIFENQNTSELGRLLKSEALTEDGFMRGMVVQQIGDIAKGIIATNKEAVQARARVQALGMALAEKALTDLAAIANRTLDLAEKQQQIQERIALENSGIAQRLQDCYALFQQSQLKLMVMEGMDPADKVAMLKMNAETYKGVEASMVNISNNNVKIVEASALPPGFFEKYADQTRCIMTQFTELTIKLAEKDESQMQIFMSEMGQTVRCLITEGAGIIKSGTGMIGSVVSSIPKKGSGALVEDLDEKAAITHQPGPSSESSSSGSPSTVPSSQPASTPTPTGSSQSS